MIRTPYFPEEDSKLRAQFMSKRRGGNAPNTAEVLVQLARKPSNTEEWQPLLITTGPEETSMDNIFIESSLSDVNLSHCIHRQGKTAAPSSYIIRSRSTGSRTIVNFNDLAEMTIEEFASIYETIGSKVRWWHFEVPPPLPLS
jgi:ketohexokinase